MENRLLTIEYVLLAGGKGSRMGSVDKGMLRKGKSTFAGILISKFLSRKNAQIIISANSEAYAGLSASPDIRMVKDNYRDAGPLGGIEAAMNISKCDLLLFCPCDMPNVNKVLELLEELSVNADNDTDAVVVCCNGRTYPTLGVYRRRILCTVRKQLAEGNYKLMDLLKQLRVKMIEIPPPIGAAELVNINTPEDYDRL